jgi:hypothetical protein
MVNLAFDFLSLSQRLETCKWGAAKKIAAIPEISEIITNPIYKMAQATNSPHLHHTVGNCGIPAIRPSKSRYIR